MNKFVRVSKPLVKEITFIGEENYFAMLKAFMRSLFRSQLLRFLQHIIYQFVRLITNIFFVITGCEGE
jgi:hypothetical protein